MIIRVKMTPVKKTADRIKMRASMSAMPTFFVSGILDIYR